MAFGFPFQAGFLSLKIKSLEKNINWGYIQFFSMFEWPLPWDKHTISG
jgi:hypothetical protein